jgi:hypothetical protein
MKGDLPTKVCRACGLPFAWRKKWAAVWEEVAYCSERCRRSSRPPPQAAGEGGGGGPQQRRSLG